MPHEKWIENSNSQMKSIKILKQDNKTFYFCQCGRKYSLERNVKYHVKWECGKVFECPTCKHSFKDFQYYRIHSERCAYKNQIC